METTIGLTIVEVREKIADIIISSQLTPSIMELIIENFLMQVRDKVREEILHDKELVSKNTTSKVEELGRIEEIGNVEELSKVEESSVSLEG